MRKLIKIFFLFSLIAFSFTVDAQVKITDMPTYVGNPNGGFVPIVISGINRKIDAKYLGFNKVDSLFKHGDTLYYRNGSGIYYFKFTINSYDTAYLYSILNGKLTASDTANKWINNLRRRGVTDTIEFLKNGTWQFAFKETAGSGFDSTFIYLALADSMGVVRDSLAVIRNKIVSDSSVFRTAIGAKEDTSAAHVNVISLNTPSSVFTTPVNFSVSNHAATGTLSLATQSANRVFAGPTTGSAATPTFRSLVAGDIPNIGESQVTNLNTHLNLKLDSVTTNSDSSKFFYWHNGTSFQWYDIRTAIAGSDTTVFETVLDSTGQAQQRVLFSKAGNKIGSSAKFLYDAINEKLGININNISQGGPNTKLVVGGNVLFTGTGSFGGSVTGITETLSDNSTKLASTAFVKGQSYISRTGISALTPILYNNSTGVISPDTTSGSPHLATQYFVSNAIAGISTVNVYNSNGTITGNRTINGNGNRYFHIDNTTDFTTTTNTGTGGAQGVLYTYPNSVSLYTGQGGGSTSGFYAQWQGFDQGNNNYSAMTGQEAGNTQTLIVTPNYMKLQSYPAKNNKFIIESPDSISSPLSIAVWDNDTLKKAAMPVSSGGTVTNASVVSANGFAGTVATSTTTPAITLSTTVTGILKGNGTAISAASAGSDYIATMPNLQQVTDVHNYTTNNIYVNDGNGQAVAYLAATDLGGGNASGGVSAYNSATTEASALYAGNAVIQSDAAFLRFSSLDGNNGFDLKPQASLSGYKNIYSPNTGHSTDTLATLFDVRAGGGGGGTTTNALSIAAELSSTGATSFDGSAAKSIAIQSGSVTNTMLAGSIDLTTKVTGLLPDGNIATASNWNTAYTERNQWDGGSTGLVAATGRTSLGATTVGTNIFTSTNPSAITFLRANADNSVDWLSASAFRTAIGAGTGNGDAVLANTQTFSGFDKFSGGFATTSYQTITSGASSTVSNATTKVIFNPASDLGTYALTLPASPTDGQEVEIITGGTITAGNAVTTTFTLSANSGQSLLTSITPTQLYSGDVILLTYQTSNTTWYRKK